MNDDTLENRIAQRIAAGALVVIVQEADEQLALAAAMLVANQCQPVVVRSATAQDMGDLLAGHATGKGTLILLGAIEASGDQPIQMRLIREVSLQQLDADPDRGIPERSKYSRLILIEQPGVRIPSGLTGDSEIITAPLPSVAELRLELDQFIADREIVVEGNGESRHALACAVAGLPRHEAFRLFSRCMVEQKQLDAAWLRSEKAKRVATKLGGALTFESAKGAAVGGLANMRAWLAARRAAFGSKKAQEWGLPTPKGMLCVGMPGCGKSLTAKTVASEWGLPLLRLDAGRLFGSLVGQSEAQTRLAIEAAEACAPCILWIDEIEKGLAGNSGSAGDSGTGARVFGALLSWMNDKTAEVFIIATANKVSAMPPELLRAGRFDAIFAVGLPSAEERREIIDIHLAKRGRSLPAEKVGALAEATDDFSGAEIEQVVIEALYSRYAADAGKLTYEDLLAASKTIVPLAKTAPEDKAAIERWAVGRARPASAVKERSVGVRRSGPNASEVN